MRRLNSIVVLALTAFILFSCSKEEIMPDTPKAYPKEITIDNWEEFVDAPEEVIHKLEMIEQEAMAPVSSSGEGESIANRVVQSGFLFGKIQAIGAGINPNSNYMGHTTVRISAGSQQYFGLASTSQVYPGHNWFVPNISNGTVCMFYQGQTGGFNISYWLNGVSSVDLVKIRRHTTGIQPFTQLWQYVAADANGNGTVEEADIDLLTDLILQRVNSLPAMYSDNYSQPIVYFPQSLYSIIQSDLATRVQWLPSFGPGTCNPNNDSVDRYAIKRGDLSGNWNRNLDL